MIWQNIKKFLAVGIIIRNEFYFSFLKIELFYDTITKFGPILF